MLVRSGGDICSPVSVIGEPGSDRSGMCPLQRKGEGKGLWNEKALALNDLPLLKTQEEKQHYGLQGNVLLTIQLLGLSQVPAWLPGQGHD